MKILKQIIKKHQNIKTLHPSVFPTSSFLLVTLAAAVYHAIYSFVQTALIANVHCTVFLGHVQVLWLLVHCQCWTLTKSPFGYPAVALSHGDTAAMFCRVSPFNTVQQVTDRGRC